LEYFYNDVCSVPWFVIFDLDNVDDKVAFLNDNVTRLFDFHAPIVSRQVRGPSKPWITPNVKRTMKERNKARTKYETTRNENDLLRYRELRNFTTTIVRQEKRSFLDFTFRNTSGKEAWTKLRKCQIYKTGKKTEVPDHLKDVNQLNAHFLSVQSNAFPDFNLLRHYYNNLKNGIISILAFSEISDEDVCKIINSITSNATGVDGVSIKMIKLCCPLLIPYIRHIINHCITSNTYPSVWKEASIIPIPKTKNPISVDDLRPVSVLPALSKVFEKAIVYQLKHHLESNSILPAAQSGFRAGYGCPAALLSITDDLLRAIDDGKAAVMVLLDYSRAFDTINHELLLSQLHFIGLGDGAVALLAAYISGRRQRVTLGTLRSASLSVASGVPQGSILGPVLYTIYTATLYDCLEHCSFHAYADDTQLYYAFNTSQSQNSISLVNKDLNRLVEMSNRHNLQINSSKCSVLLFGCRSWRLGEGQNVKISIGDNDLPICERAKNLGVIIDSDLRFKSYISSLLQKSYSTLKLLYSNRHILNKDLKITLCDSLILSNFNYCDVLYNSCLDQQDCKRIQMVQNACLRFIYGLRKHDHVSQYLERAGWMCMADRRTCHCCVFYHKILIFKSPPYLYHKIKFRTDIHNINVRRKDFISIPKYRLEIFKRSFSYSIASNYNKLPPQLKNLSISLFRRKIKDTVLKNEIV